MDPRELERIDRSRINNSPPPSAAEGRGRRTKYRQKLVRGLFNSKLLAFARDKSGESLRDARDADEGLGWK